MKPSEIQNLKVGDVVGIVPSHSRNTYTKPGYVVKKINGRDHISVAKDMASDVVYVFDKYGNDRDGDRIWGAFLITDQDARQRNAQLQKRLELNVLGREIEAMLAGCKNGYGDYYLTGDVKVKLLELVNKI